MGQDWEGLSRKQGRIVKGSAGIGVRVGGVSKGSGAGM